VSLLLAWSACCVLPGPSGILVRDTSAGRVDTASIACLGGSRSLTLGLGTDRFDKMPDEVDAVAGPQGGHHLEFAFRATGVDVSDWTNVWIEGRVDDELVIEQGARLGFDCLPSGTAEALGLLVGIPEDRRNDTFDFVVTLTDAAGAEVEDRASVKVRL
jgi:hypothetical protein